MQSLISVRDLHVRYPAARRRTVRALDGVSLDIRSGETLGLVGESGCGKSTLGRAIAGLVHCCSGVIQSQGFLRTQMVFQDPFSSLDPRMTARSIIAEAIPRARDNRIDELMMMVGLDPSLASRYPHEFSGGQRQRIGIARAIAAEPHLIIADEPIASLDVSIQAQILNLLQNLQQRLGLTYLFISHDLRAVHHVSDRIAVMYLGRIVEVGPAEHVYARPRMPYTQALLSAMPATIPASRSALSVLQGDIPSPVNPPSGCGFRTRCPLAVPACSLAVPELREIAPGHTAACHLL